MPVRRLLFLFLATLFSQTAWAQETELPSQSVEDFISQDYRGQEFKLSDIKDQEIVVLAFLGTECPLVKLYGSRLRILLTSIKIVA